jgi:hypothetical protein
MALRRWYLGSLASAAQARGSIIVAAYLDIRPI